MDQPIYSDNPIFGTLPKTSGKCPARSDICNNLPGVSIIDSTYTDIPLCSSGTFHFTNNINEAPNGCCVVDVSNEPCSAYFTTDIKEENKFYDMGIDLTDISGTNRRSICHSAPIRKRNLVISEIVIVIVVSAIIVIITAIIGACYEFIFKYGECKDCIYYKSNCLNRKRLSVIDYMFPTDVCTYPYQECNKTNSVLTGGGPEKTGFISTYAEYAANGTKCITVHDVEVMKEKPFPYNLIDYANNNVKSELLRMPFRAFALFFLYTVLVSRILISKLLKRLSIVYQQTIKHNPVLSNFMFLCFTGILFNIIANYANIPELNGANGYILYVLIMIAAFSFSVSTFVGMLFLWWAPSMAFETYYRQCDIPRSYYKLMDYKKLFYSTYEYKEKRLLHIVIGHIFLDILLIFPIMIMISFSLGIGLISSTIAFLYIVASLLFNMFYIPLSNTVEFLDIIKSHGNLLTILFCVTVLIASLSRLNNVTTGIIGGILAVIILIKTLKNLY
jgi:hypothetical protein